MSSIFLRDLDGTGSLHPCGNGDPGAIEFVLADRIQELEAENRDLYHEIENHNIQTNEHIEQLSGVHAGTHAIVPVKATPQMIAEGWACLKRNHLPKLGPGKCLIEAWPAMIEASKGKS